MEQIYSFLFREKPSSILLAIYSSHVDLCGLDLCRVVDTTYSHALIILSMFERRGIVYFKKEGRSKFIYLTDKGRNIAEALNYIRVNL